MIVLMGQGQSHTESGTGVVKVMIEKQIKGDPMEKAEETPVKEVSIDWERGLTSEEARKRIGEYGYNEVAEKRVSRTIQFVKKFWGITPWMLEITIGLEWALGKYFEMYVVMGLLVFNAILGFIQEERANSAL
jgi:H+-transporting ATPase